MKREEKLLAHELTCVTRKEERHTTPKTPSVLQKKTEQLVNAAEEMVPDKVRQTLELAFQKAFETVQGGGAGLIAKAGGLPEKQKAYRINRFVLEETFQKKNLRRFDKQAKKSMLGNKGLSAAEGGVLGVLGIGLPDIPIFLGMLFKTVYEVGTSYGFDCKMQQEEAFALRILCAAAAKGEERVSYSAAADVLAAQIDTATTWEDTRKADAGAASHLLCNRLLCVKAVQGIPLIGAVGGVANYALLREVGITAQEKYKKRFLRRLQRKITKKEG